MSGLVVVRSKIEVAGLVADQTDSYVFEHELFPSIEFHPTATVNIYGIAYPVGVTVRAEFSPPLTWAELDTDPDHA